MATTASGKGRILGMAEWTDDDLITDVEWPTPPVSDVVSDWFWVGGPPDVTIIPWTWLQVPTELRADPPINTARITGAGGAVAFVTNLASKAAWRTFAASGQLDTIIPDDANNYARMLTTYYANPLMRAPVFTLSLVPRTIEEVWKILGLGVGDRFTLGPGTVHDGVTTVTLPVPAGLPVGVQSLVISGVAHTTSVIERKVHWTTAPLLGAAVGSEGPWFRLDTSVTDGSDMLPF